MVRAALLDRTMRRISHGSPGGGLMPYLPVMFSGALISDGWFLVTALLAWILSEALPWAGERVLSCTNAPVEGV
jgi:hypothetical protein